jgi:hypothetical protein
VEKGKQNILGKVYNEIVFIVNVKVEEIDI